MLIFAVFVQENNGLGGNALSIKLGYTAGSNKKRK